MHCKARHVLRDLFSTNQRNGSEATFVAKDIQKFENLAILDDLIQAVIWRDQYFKDGQFEPSKILADVLLELIS